MRHIPIEGSLPYRLRGQQLFLLPQKAIYWQEQRTLLIADLHLGKAGHFRKAGIPIPRQVHQQDLQLLQQLIRLLQPAEVVMLGDLFHSEHNQEWYDFDTFLAQNQETTFVLVKGNHDILPEAVYQVGNLSLAHQALHRAPFSFTHKPGFSIPGIQRPEVFLDLQELEGYNLAGHLHPGASVRDPLGHLHKVPGFYFSALGGVLPAFGSFTGFKCLPRHPQQHLFGIFPASDTRHRVLPVA